MSEPCDNCGKANAPTADPEPVDASGQYRETPYECHACGAEGVVLSHPRAGVVSRRGRYFATAEADPHAGVADD